MPLIPWPSHQQVHLMSIILLTVLLTFLRYKKTYWQAPGSATRLTHVEAVQLTQQGKIPYAVEYEVNTGRATGDITFKEDLYPYDTTQYPIQ